MIKKDIIGQDLEVDDKVICFGIDYKLNQIILEGIIIQVNDQNDEDVVTIKFKNYRSNIIKYMSNCILKVPDFSEIYKTLFRLYWKNDF